MNKRQRFLFLGLIFTFFLFLVLSPAYGLRKRTRKRASSGGGGGASVSRGVKTWVRFRSDRRGLLLNFSNFDDLDSVRYELVYESNGVTQAAGGTVSLGDTSTREVLFGTCSGGSCVYHPNITNARLSIVSTLKNGLKVLKPYRIRV